MMPAATPSDERLLRVNEVTKQVGLCRASIYNRMHKGQFPPPVRLGDNCVRWRSGDIARWISDLSARRSN